MNRLHAKLDKQDQHGNTALHIAVIHGKSESYRYVRGARPDAAGDAPSCCAERGRKLSVTPCRPLPRPALALCMDCKLEDVQNGVEDIADITERLTPLQLAAKLGVRCTQARASCAEVKAQRWLADPPGCPLLHSFAEESPARRG